MFGTQIETQIETHSQREDRLRLERRDRLRRFISEDRPVSAIAMLESLDFSYAKLLVRQLIKDEKLTYNPAKISKSGDQPILGLTEESRQLRGQLGNALAKLKHDKREVTLMTGIMFRSIEFARDKPNNFDWSLSQIERLARSSSKTFRQLVLESILTPDEKAKAVRCGIL